jgi:site-specific DNA-methyltransferase (adenine-specific)
VQRCFPDTKKGSDKPRNRNTVGSFGMPNNTTQEYSDSGNASRFFKSILYYPKASKAEKNKGCEELEEKTMGKNQSSLDGGKMLTGSGNERNNTSKNFHPTVKPVALISYLIILVTPKGGTVLDPFGGSGTTAVAAVENGFKYILIEKEAEHIPIIEARVKAATKEENTAEDKQPINQLSLF